MKYKYVYILLVHNTHVRSHWIQSIAAVVNMFMHSDMHQEKSLHHYQHSPTSAHTSPSFSCQMKTACWNDCIEQRHQSVKEGMRNESLLLGRRTDRQARHPKPPTIYTKKFNQMYIWNADKRNSFKNLFAKKKILKVLTFMIYICVVYSCKNTSFIMGYYS